MKDQTADRIADLTAGVSAAGFTGTIFIIDEIVSIAAGIAAIVAGLCSAWYYLKKARQLDGGTERDDP